MEVIDVLDVVEGEVVRETAGGVIWLKTIAGYVIMI